MIGWTSFTCSSYCIAASLFLATFVVQPIVTRAGSNTSSQYPCLASQASAGAGTVTIAKAFQHTVVITEQRASATVHLAVELFVRDVRSVVKGAVVTALNVSSPSEAESASAQADVAVVVGVTGEQTLVEQVAASAKADVSALRGQWEAWAIRPIPLQPGAKSRPTLLVAGSDRRGVAYALFGLCEESGVSPWYWCVVYQVGRPEARIGFDSLEIGSVFGVHAGGPMYLSVSERLSPCKHATMGLPLSSSGVCSSTMSSLRSLTGLISTSTPVKAARRRCNRRFCHNSTQTCLSFFCA